MFGIAQIFANIFEVDTAAIVLLLAILLAYPVNLLYVVLLRERSIEIKSGYFLACGVLITILSYGFDSIHYAINCCFCYIALRWLPNKLAVVCNFAFTLIYLLCGYYLNQIDWNYSITWTTAQCVLTLRLIAISFDVLDGKNKSDSKEVGRHTESAIPQLPPFHLFMSFCYFPGTLMVGPLIPYLTYLKFLSSSTYNQKAFSISSYRLLGGFVSLFIFFYGSMFWPLDYLRSDAFNDSGFCWKLIAMALVAKMNLYKYISVWMMAEAACILSGITYDGINFYCHTNVNLFKFELAHNFTTIIGSYNMTTNQFAFKYIFRRLKFLGNINLSRLITLLFLSVWHGTASGYYFSFLAEFLVLYFEKNLATRWHALQSRYALHSDLLKPIIWICGRFYTFFFTGYTFIPFMYLFHEVWLPIWSSVYFWGHLTLFFLLFCFQFM